MPKTPTASDVRNYFRGDEKRLARLSPEAQKTVAEGARGRLAPEAVKVFNSKRRKDSRYSVGATGRVAAEQKAQAKAQREAAVKAGVEVGQRGPLSKAAKAALSTSKG